MVLIRIKADTSKGGWHHPNRRNQKENCRISKPRRTVFHQPFRR